MMNVRSLHIIIFIMAALFVLGLSASGNGGKFRASQSPLASPFKGLAATPERSFNHRNQFLQEAYLDLAGATGSRKPGGVPGIDVKQLAQSIGIFNAKIGVEAAIKSDRVAVRRRLHADSSMGLDRVPSASASVANEGSSGSVSTASGTESSGEASESRVVEVSRSGQPAERDVEQGAQREEVSGRASVVTLLDDTVEAVGGSHDAEAASLVKTDLASRYSSKLALVSSLVFILSLGREAAKLRGLTVTRRLQLVHEGSDVELVSSSPKAFGLAMKRIVTAGRCCDAKMLRASLALLLGSSATWIATR